MSYSLAEAAKAAGRSKPAILSAIQKGRISAKKNDFGLWEIDPAELHRVYKPISQPVTGFERDLPVLVYEKEAKIKELEARLQALEELKKEIQGRNEDLKQERDNWKQQADEWRMQAKALPSPEVAATATKKSLWWWPPSWLMIA